MRIRRTAAYVIAAALASTSAPAQTVVHNETGQTTMTQERRAAAGQNSDLIWNLIGCLGLLGFAGMWRSSDNDGYTDDPI
jgi:hypothetical protein